jgi:hypothetical protein
MQDSFNDNRDYAEEEANAKIQEDEELEEDEDFFAPIPPSNIKLSDLQ